VERWRKPITVAAVETDPDWVIEGQDGVTYDDYDLTFPAESWERIREGRACLRCWETQPEAFPAVERHLPGCPYAPDGIRRQQRLDISREFRGAKWVGPSKKLAETLAEDDERRAKLRRDFGVVSPPTVPPWVKV
jgi:hypothetical protein